jgi:hypothetical protein
VQLYHLIYVSIASGDLSDDQLVDILQISRANNARDDISGMLLYKERRFMQLLEGPESAVCATYGRIARDVRHRDASILLEGETAERDFVDWTMGFQALDGEAARAIPGFSPFLDVQFSVFDFRSDPSRAHQLLRVFRRI